MRLPTRVHPNCELDAWFFAGEVNITGMQNGALPSTAGGALMSFDAVLAHAADVAVHFGPEAEPLRFECTVSAIRLSANLSALVTRWLEVGGVLLDTTVLIMSPHTGTRELV